MYFSEPELTIRASVTACVRTLWALLSFALRYIIGLHCEFLLSPSFFFFNDTATTEIYTLSLHDALPVSRTVIRPALELLVGDGAIHRIRRSEEHTSELQSRPHLVCRLLLEKKKRAPRGSARRARHGARAAGKASARSR